MLLASVIVYQCDNCPQIIAVKTDQDQEKFEADWHNGIFFDFCPKCRYKIETQERILRDENFRFHTYSGEKKDVGFIN